MTSIQRIALVTDFGGSGPYVGQVMLRLSELAPDIPVIDLVSDLPPFRPDLAAYLLPALARDVARGTLYLCVVDPGVGGDRQALIVEADGNIFVGPDNGLFAILVRRVAGCRVWNVKWRPVHLSASFHGRDLFAPVAAMLAAGAAFDTTEINQAALQGMDCSDELPKVIYKDPYGNLMIGVEASQLDRGRIVRAGSYGLVYARTFCEVSPGQPFWYENSLGLVELAVNRGKADQVLGLVPGDPIRLDSDA